MHSEVFFDTGPFAKDVFQNSRHAPRTTGLITFAPTSSKVALEGFLYATTYDVMNYGEQETFTYWLLETFTYCLRKIIKYWSRQTFN